MKTSSDSSLSLTVTSSSDERSASLEPLICKGTLHSRTRVQESASAKCWGVKLSWNAVMEATSKLLRTVKRKVSFTKAERAQTTRNKKERNRKNHGEVSSITPNQETWPGWRSTTPRSIYYINQDSSPSTRLSSPQWMENYSTSGGWGSLELGSPRHYGNYTQTISRSLSTNGGTDTITNRWSQSKSGHPQTHVLRQRSSDGRIDTPLPVRSKGGRSRDSDRKNSSFFPTTDQTNALPHKKTWRQSCEDSPS